MKEFLLKVKDFVVAEKVAVLLVAAFVSLVVGASLALTLLNTPVTTDKFISCGQDEFVQMVQITETYKGFGFSKKDLLEQLGDSDAPKETIKLAKRALEYVFDKEYKNGATLEVIVGCLNS